MPRPKVHPDLPPVRGATAADTAPPLAIGSADSSSTQGDPVDHSNPNGSAKFPMRNIRVSVTLADESSTDKATPSIVPRSTTWSSRSRRNTDPGPVGADDARERSSILMPPQHDPLDFSDLSDADGVDTDGAPAEAGPAEAGLADTTAHSAFAPRDIPSRDIPSTSRRSSAPPAQSDSTPQGRKRSSVMSFLFRSLSSDHVAAAAVQTSSKWHAAKHAIVAFSERRLPDQESSRKKLGAMLAPGALGTLTFSNYNTAMYARVGSTSRQVRSALIRHLAAQYGYPRLLLSVAGGAQDFQLSSDLLHVLTRGLTAVADATPVWLTTPGTNSGVTTYAGRVVKNANASVAGIDAKRARIPAIGMVTAGVQRGREQLRDPDTTRIFDYNSLSPAKSGPKSPNVGLDENHHVFLCYDDLVDDKFGREVSFRTRFEEDMRYLKLNSSATLSSQQPFLIKDECAVAVQLIVEGGPITLKIVEDSIKSGMPVVVLEGSGRCADVISYAWRFLHDTSISARTKYTEGGLRGEIRKLGKKTLAAILATEKRVLSLVAVKSWVTVCTTSEKASRHSDDAVNLDGAILQAVVQSLTFKPKHDYSVKQIVSGTMTHCGFYYGMDPYEAGLYVMHRTQLSWALTFNNVVSAKFHLSALQNLVTDCRATLVSLGDSTYQRARHVLKEHTSDIKDVLVWALCHANVRNDFVIMFCGPLSNSDALYELLMSDAGDLSSPSETFDTTRRKSKRTRPDGSSGSESVALMKCGRSVRDTLFAPSTNRLSEKRMEALYRWAGTKTSESWETDGTHCMNAVVARLLRLDKRRLCVVGHRGADPSMQTVVEKKNSAYRDLLIWATISSQSQLADFFWQEGGHSISSALFTALLLKRMRAAAPMQRGEFHNSRVLMLEMANHFEDRAVGVLEECQRENAKFTEYILWRNLANLGLTKSECQIRDALSLAAHGGCMKFISHSACLAAVSVAWHGAIVPETSILVILANALCPIFLILNCFRCNFRSFDAVQNIRSLRGNAKEGASSMGHKLPSRGRESQSRESLASSDEKTQEKSQEWTSVEKIVGLYTAPVTKYLLHFLEHVSLLLLITTEVLSDYASDDPLKWYTIATLLIVVNHVLHQIALMCEKGRLDWYTNAWNRYDMLTYTFFGLGLGLRIYSGGDRGNIAVWAKFVMVVVTLMLFLRFFRFYYLQPQLGPKLIMLQKMTRDVLTFLALLVVILVAYAIAFEAMRRPFTEHDWGHAQDGLRILLLPSFQMFGEIFLEDMEQETGCAGPQLFQSCQNQLQGFVLPVLIFIYCLLSNVVLVNLLIAMMGRTYEEVQVSAFEQWHLQLYFLLKDYEDWTVLPAPLSVFESLYRIGNAVFVRLCKDRPVDHVLSPIAESEAHFGASPKGPQLAMLESFQEKCTQRYFDEANKITVSPAEEKQTSKLDRIDAQIEHMHARLEDILMDTEILKQAFNSECQRQTFGRTMQNCDPGGLSARQRVSSGQWSPATRISRANSIDDSSTNGAGSLDELIRIYRQDRYENPFRPFRGGDMYPRSPDRYPPRGLFTEVPIGQKLSWYDLDIGESNADTPVMFALLKKESHAPSQYNAAGISTQQSEGIYATNNIFVAFASEKDFFDLSRHTSADIRSTVLGVPRTKGGEKVVRVDVPADVANWDAPWAEYGPIEYTSPYAIFRSPGSPGEQHPWTSTVHPRDMGGKHPLGRTGLAGRGCLPKWGPNTLTTWVITRWKRDEAGMHLKREGSGLLEVLLIAKDAMQDKTLWSLPHAFEDLPNPALSAAFGLQDDEAEKHYEGNVRTRDGGRKPEVFESVQTPNGITETGKVSKTTSSIDRSPSDGESSIKRKETSTNIQAVENFLRDVTVEEMYKVILGDHMDTDDAWVETSVRHLHDDFGVLDLCPLTANGAWFTVNKHLNNWLDSASNDEMLIHAVQLRLGAFWR